jgi:phage gp29-like protein
MAEKPKSQLVSPHSKYIPADQLRSSIDQQSGGTTEVYKGDPGFQPPTDPLTGGVKERTSLVYRDIPLTTIGTNWTVQGVQSALSGHVNGQFDGSGQLVDAILGDDRVQATLGSRISGLFGRELKFKPADDSDAARECCDAWQASWAGLSKGYAMHDMHAYAIFMGFEPGQLLWDTSGPIWTPQLRPWHPRYTYYHWTLRKFIAMTMDGQMPIIPGDGKWVLHSPYGDYRGWIRGAVRSVSEPWLIRHFAYRDWARYSEVHGMPIRKAIVPAAASEEDRDRFQAQLSQLGQETTIMVGAGVDQFNSYDLQLVEASDRSWENFPGLIDRCDMSIILALLFQNLTTEVKGGSLAATEAHMDIRQSGIMADNEAWKTTIRDQIARPFAFLNFGDANLAPFTEWDVTARQDFTENAKMFQQFGTAIEVLRRGGVEFQDVEELRRWATVRFGLGGLPDFQITEPVSAGGLGK